MAQCLSISKLTARIVPNKLYSNRGCGECDAPIFISDDGGPAPAALVGELRRWRQWRRRCSDAAGRSKLLGRAVPGGAGCSDTPAVPPLVARSRHSPLMIESSFPLTVSESPGRRRGPRRARGVAARDLPWLQPPRTTRAVRRSVQFRRRVRPVCRAVTANRTRAVAPSRAGRSSGPRRRLRRQSTFVPGGGASSTRRALLHVLCQSARSVVHKTPPVARLRAACRLARVSWSGSRCARARRTERVLCAWHALGARADRRERAGVAPPPPRL